MKTLPIGPALLAAACAVLAPSMAAAQPVPIPVSPQDRSFLMKAIMGDTAQIALGQRAEKGGPAINGLGVMLVQERNQARDRADQLAKTEGFAPPQTTSQKASREYAKLDRLSGPRFNYAFVKYIITADRRAIGAYRREARGQGPVADLARSSLPSLQKQLRVAIGLFQQDGS